MLIAEKNESGYSFTLTSYALTFLDNAQVLFGARDSSIAYGGVEIANNPSPQVWFPSFEYGNYVVIQLTPTVLQNHTQAIYQLSHEVIHVLSPNGTNSTNNLEEGLAAWFSVHITDKYAGNRDYAIRDLEKSPYHRPYQLVSNLLTQDPDIIRKARLTQPLISQVCKEDFFGAGLPFSKDNVTLLNELLLPYNHLMVAETPI
jgi:hypothetical protein